MRQAEPVLVPCGHTLASVCPPCAERAKTLRAAQCRGGWHLEAEPVIEPDGPDEEQRYWIETRADTRPPVTAPKTPGTTSPSWTS